MRISAVFSSEKFGALATSSGPALPGALAARLGPALRRPVSSAITCRQHF